MTLLDTDRKALVAIKNLPADRHPVAAYVGRLAPGSRPTMRGALHTIAKWLTKDRLDATTLDWSRIRYQHSKAVRAHLAATCAPSTANKMLSALRGVLKECWRLGLMDTESYHHAIDVEAVKGERLSPGRALTGGELRSIFNACAKDDNRASGSRDAGLLAVMYGAGLRRSEVVALKLGDYNAETGELIIHRGKGNRDRIAFVVNGASEALADWLSHRGSGGAGDPLFTRVNKGGRVIAESLTTQAVYNACIRRAEDAAVSGFSPHDLRRSNISDLLDHGVDVLTVQRLAGHRNVTTTARYDRRPEATKKKAAETLHIPYRSVAS